MINSGHNKKIHSEGVRWELLDEWSLCWLIFLFISCFGVFLLLFQQGKMGFFLSRVHLELVDDLLNSHAFPIPHWDDIIHGQNDVDGIAFNGFYIMV
jgi:uncharacterized membrane protein